MTTSRCARTTPGLLLVCLFAGCGGGTDDGPELAPVWGTVTLDGEPLVEARVIFTPAGGGRAAIGVTDDRGVYKLAYVADRMGTPPGEYVVKISTYREPEEDEESGEMSPTRPETVPAMYNQPSTLRVTVPADDYNFALKSGEIVQPRVSPEE